MLLSMYLLYRLARSTNLKSYIPKITVFILAVSLLSTLFPVSIYTFLFTFPVTFLSWPAYSWVSSEKIFDENFIPHWVKHRGIRFLAVSVEYDLRTTFSFFLFVNILGALLGYWIGKKHRIQLLNRKWWPVIGVVCAGFWFTPFILPSYLWLYPVGRFLGYAWFYLPGFGIILLETILLSLLMDARKRHPKKKLLDYIKEAGAYY